MKMISAALLASIACLFASPAMSADAQLQTFVRIDTFDGSPLYESGTNEATAMLESDGLAATGLARADYGLVYITGHATAASSSSPNDAISINAGAAMQDAVTVVPAPGSLPPPRGPYTGVFIGSVTLSGSTPLFAEYQTTGPEGFFAVHLNPGTTEVRGAFILGQPVVVGFALLGTTSASSAFRLVGDVESSIRWNGISQAFIGSAEVPFTIASASGFNWALAAPIPEPPIVALLAIALGALGVRVVGGRA